MKVGITMGDPSGVGPEVTLKALEILGRVSESPLQGQAQDLSLQDGVIIGTRNIIEETKRRFGIRWDGEVISCLEISREDIEYGKVSKLAGQAAYEFILRGYELVSSGEIDALVTAPVCKASINLVDPSFSGHTELLAKLSHVRRFAMMLMGCRVRVTLVTTHISIKEVASKLKEEDIVDKIELTHEFLTERLDIKSPKIGVCALNPHGGEGVFGDEEERIISPAISAARDEGIEVDGPYPADTLFVRSGGFDAIIAMYHDQGMIPLKIKEFGGAVNITLGLPFIRTSPDHGTAFDIAGKGVANPESMINAIKLAQKLVNTEGHRSNTTEKHQIKNDAPILLYEELTAKIRQLAFEVHEYFGNGFLEKVYENSLAHRLRKLGIKCEQQVPLKVYFENIVVGEYFADLVIEDKIVVELKTVENLEKFHFARLKHYLKATGFRLGLLINFGKPKLEFKRVIL